MSSSSRPKHQLIYDALAAEIAGGGLAQGDRLPTEAELAAPDLTGGEPVLEEAQSSPAIGLEPETLEALVQAVPEDTAQAAQA